MPGAGGGKGEGREADRARVKGTRVGGWRGRGEGSACLHINPPMEWPMKEMWVSPAPLLAFSLPASTRGLISWMILSPQVCMPSKVDFFSLDRHV